MDEGVMSEKPAGEWLSVAEVAAEMRVHSNTVRAWLKSGRFRRVRRGSKRLIRIHRDELDTPEVKA